MKMDLIAPIGDKGWSFQISAMGNPPHLAPKIRESLLILLNTPIVKRAQPILQGDCMDWLMVEFCTDDENAIVTAANFLEKSLK